jgi:hypothetical protein
VDGNIVFTSMCREVSLSSLHHQEEKEMTKLFHIKIQVKKTTIYVLFDSGSQSSYPLSIGLGKQGFRYKGNEQCNIKFVVSVDFIDELELDTVPLYVCGIMFGSHHMYMRDTIFMWISN